MPKKTTASERPQVILQVDVRSIHPSIETAVVLRDIERARSELKKSLSSEHRVGSVSFKRRGTLPIGLESALISIMITLGTEVGKEAAKKVADDAYNWLKTKWKNARFRKLKPKAAGKSKSSDTKRHRSMR